MTVVALLSVAPVTEGSMAPEVAKAVAALDDFDVSYETNPMGTVVEADDIDTLLAAVAAAHKAVDGDRVSTFLKVDDSRLRRGRSDGSRSPRHPRGRRCSAFYSSDWNR